MARIDQREAGREAVRQRGGNRRGMRAGNERQLQEAIGRLNQEILAAQEQIESLSAQGVSGETLDALRSKVRNDKELLSSLQQTSANDPARTQDLGELSDAAGTPKNLSAPQPDRSSEITGQDQSKLQGYGGFRDRNKELSLEEQDLIRQEQDLAGATERRAELPALGSAGRPDLRTEEGVAEFMAAHIEKKGGSAKGLDFYMGNLAAEGNFDPMGERRLRQEASLDVGTVPARDTKGNLGKIIRGPQGEYRWKVDGSSGPGRKLSRKEMKAILNNDPSSPLMMKPGPLEALFSQDEKLVPTRGKGVIRRQMSPG